MVAFTTDAADRARGLEDALRTIDSARSAVQQNPKGYRRSVLWAVDTVRYAINPGNMNTCAVRTAGERKAIRGAADRLERLAQMTAGTGSHAEHLTTLAGALDTLRSLFAPETVEASS